MKSEKFCEGGRRTMGKMGWSVASSRAWARGSKMTRRTSSMFSARTGSRGRATGTTGAAGGVATAKAAGAESCGAADTGMDDEAWSALLAWLATRRLAAEAAEAAREAISNSFRPRCRGVSFLMSLFIRNPDFEGLNERIGQF